MDLFPMIQPELMATDNTLLLYREVAWDFEKGKPIWQNGTPKIVEGAEAVKVWAWKALVTQRARWKVYTWDFGSELDSLIGQNYSEQTKRAEAIRYVREALEINPYITSVGEVTTSFAGDKMTLHVKLNTVYGEVMVYV